MKEWALSIFRPVLLSSLKEYSTMQFRKDLIAGIIVGVVALPLGLAFAIASGVSPEKGLVTAIIAGLCATLFGGSKVLISGPTGAFVLIISGIIEKHGLEGLAISTFLAGAILVLMGVLKLGKAIKFIPYPIIIGFNAGIALSIFTSQIKELFGLSFSTNPSNFVERWVSVFQNIGTATPWAIGLGALTIAIILIAPKISTKIPGFLAAIVIIATAAYILKEHFGVNQIRTISDCFLIDDRFPMPQNFDFRLESLRDYLSSSLTLALMGAMVALITSTVADGSVNGRHDSNTELIAQGVTNMIIPFFGAIPSTGAIARTMTGINNGGRTPIVSLVHAVVLLIILVSLAPLSLYIPTACLAGMLVVAAYNMSGWRSIRSLFRASRSEFLVMLTTLSLTVLFDLAIAIEVGLVMAIFLLFHRVQESSSIYMMGNEIDPTHGTDLTSQEKLLVPKGVEVYEIDGPFFFGMANKFDEQMSIIGDKPKVRILRMRHVPFIDSSGLHNLEDLANNCRKEEIRLILSGVTKEVQETLERSGFTTKFDKQFICENIQIALHKAHIELDRINSKKNIKSTVK
ncbi:MAG: SulP family inorganic anion transporter [Bacteroidales bacterium]